MTSAVQSSVVPFVATLVCAPGALLLSDAVVYRVSQVLPDHPAPRWLDPFFAADFVFTPGGSNPPRFFSDLLREVLEEFPIDVVVQPLLGRRKKLFLADMDSTMIGQECIDELADCVGLKCEVSAITERAMRGELEFDSALRERVALLRGLSADIVDKILADRITLTPGGVQLVRTMRSRGACTCLVSGGFTLFSERIASLIGFQESYANRLIIEDGLLTGQVEAPILGREEKLATLLELRSHYNLSSHETLAIGDGANDLLMLKGAGLGVAFRAKPAVAAAADARIDHADLTALLYAQGYHRRDFAEI